MCESLNVRNTSNVTLTFVTVTGKKLEIVSQLLNSYHLVIHQFW